MMLPTSSRSGKKTSKVVTPDWHDLVQLVCSQLHVGFEMTSPVVVSTTSAAVIAPSSSEVSTSIC